MDCTTQVDEYHTDDDTYSTGGDSGFSVGKTEDDYEDSLPEEVPNFFSRVASIPIIQDSYMSAHQFVQQNTVGKRALGVVETSIQSFAKPSLLQNAVISRINTLGNRSLDMIERQLPMIVKPTDEIIDPIKERFVSELEDKKSNMINPRVNAIADQLESMMNQYLPEWPEALDSEEKQGIDRLMNTIHNLSIRTSKVVSEKMSATAEEEKQLKKIVQLWIMTTVTENQPLKQHVDSIQEKFGAIYEFVQAEIEKFRQELFNVNISHRDRIRNILNLSQTDILLPLYHRSLLAWKIQGQPNPSI